MEQKGENVTSLLRFVQAGLRKVLQFLPSTQCAQNAGGPGQDHASRAREGSWKLEHW